MARAKMSQEEKFKRSEARVLGGWALSAIRNARLKQIQADDWRELEDRACVTNERSEADAARALELEADAVKYARKAAHHAMDALQARDAERLRRGLER